MSGAALIWCPFASEADAIAAADRLLEEGLIACANILPAMRSIYLWKGERGEAQECGALFKTGTGLLAKAIGRLEEIHPYETPAIVGWRTDGAGAATDEWINAIEGTGS